MTAAIRNPVEPTRSREGLFLVDTGATECVVSRQRLEAPGFMTEGQLTRTGADGSEIRMRMASG